MKINVTFYAHTEQVEWAVAYLLYEEKKPASTITGLAVRKRLADWFERDGYAIGSSSFDEVALANWDLDDLTEKQWGTVVAVTERLKGGRS